MTTSTEANFRMPVIFVGHGSPMNAIEQNEFTAALRRLGETLTRPGAILCISAHWLTKGAHVHVSSTPKMIYDMYGFPKELYQVKYPAAGSPEHANELIKTVKNVPLHPDQDWGFDHGNWSIMVHLFPKADIPVFQMSIDYHKPMRYHYELAGELKSLRKKGVLIIGSGNLTHNLRMVNFDHRNVKPEDWAFEFDLKMKSFLDEKNHHSILNYQSLGLAAHMAVPEPSHFIPLIYTIGLQEKDERITYFYDKIEYGSLSMRSLNIH